MSRKAGPVVTNDGAISVADWDTTTLNDEGSYWCDAKFGDAGTLTSSTAVLYIRGRLLACHLLVTSTALPLNTTSFSCPVLRSKTCQGSTASFKLDGPSNDKFNKIGARRSCVGNGRLGDFVILSPLFFLLYVCRPFRSIKSHSLRKTNLPSINQLSRLRRPREWWF